MLSDDVKKEFQKIEEYGRRKNKEQQFIFQERHPYSEVFPRKKFPDALKEYVIKLCKLFLKEEVLPKTDNEWEKIFIGQNVKVNTNGNLMIVLNKEAKIEDKGFFPGFEGEYWISIMINKNIFSVDIMGEGIYDTTDFLEKMRAPETTPSIKPLNPEDFEYIQENEYTTSTGRVVSEESRASWAYIKIKIKKNFGLSEIGQVFQKTVHVPLTPTKWYLCEYSVIMETYRALIKEAIYTQRIENNICNPETRKKAYEEMERKYRMVKEFYSWFSGVKYPEEVKNVRNQQIAGIGIFLKDWEMVLKYWEKILRENPEETEKFYKLKAKELNEMIKKELGWTRIDLMEQLNLPFKEFRNIYEKKVLEFDI